MDFVGVIAIDVGLVCVFVGFLSVCKPLAFLRIKSRRTGWAVMLVGVSVIALGMKLPIRETRVAVVQTRLDELVPVYQFHEWHTITIAAPPDRVYEAIKEVEPDEILGYRALTWTRRFGRAGRPGILNPPAHQPLLRTALQTGFLELADDPSRGIVFGFVASPLLVAKPTAETFKSVIPFSAKVAMDFRIIRLDANHCVLTTETRIYSNDSDIQRFFAPYWRVIYPGSAIMRRMWLRAIRKRAEANVIQKSESGNPPPGSPLSNRILSDAIT